MNVADPKTSFAVWLDTQTQWKVQYSIPLFHEIDFEVNEGYRRIPHGGVEVGGVLYGQVDAGSVTISAFRPIECDHAAGPSFLLSDSDLSKLASSLESASKDDELKNLVPVGWFIAHTRGPLQMTNRELQIFGQFFPEPRRVTVLVKPERFKPTRFAFLIRDQTGRVSPEGSESAVILPLSGRAGKAPELPPVSSEVPGSARDVHKTQSESRAVSNSNGISADAVPDLRTPIVSSSPVPVLEQLATPTPPAERLATSPVTPTSGRQSQTLRRPRRSGLLVTVLFLAAVLGCGIGYWAYLQLPPTVIQLRVQKRQSDLLVVWNPVQTQAASYSAIRVNDGKPVMLTADQKTSGIAAVPLSANDLKIEIVSRQWARESRGIVRLLQEASASSR